MASAANRVTVDFRDMATDRSTTELDGQGRRARRRGEDRVLTIPNGFTAVRLLCVPVFVWLLSRPHRTDWLAAAILLGALGATDWVDGQLARRLHQVSTFGKAFDPIADRILLAVGAIGILVVGAVPPWIAGIALGREALVALGAAVVAVAGGRRMDVQLVGKAATFGLMFALPLFLAGHSTVSWHHGAEVLAWVAAIPALVLGWVAVVIYVPLARTAIAAGRSEAQAGLLIEGRGASVGEAGHP